MLYELTGETHYIDNAVLAMFYAGVADNGKYKGAVVNDEFNGGDLPGFKGIMTRWFGYALRRIYNDEELSGYREQADKIRDWLILNAETVWGNRNKDNTMWTRWNMKTYDVMDSALPGGPPLEQFGPAQSDAKYYHNWGCSTALSLLFNMHNFDIIDGEIIDSH